jgi:hypothetical protein
VSRKSKEAYGQLCHLKLVSFQVPCRPGPRDSQRANKFYQSAFFGRMSHVLVTLNLFDVAGAHHPALHGNGSMLAIFEFSHNTQTNICTLEAPLDKCTQICRMTATSNPHAHATKETCTQGSCFALTRKECQPPDSQQKVSLERRAGPKCRVAGR